MAVSWSGDGPRGGGGGSGLAGLRETAARALAAAAREARANPRVLIGLAAILLLLWGYGLMGLLDAVAASERRLAGIESEIRRQTATAGEKGWAERAESAQALRQRLLARLWPGETEGQAQADFQEAIGRAVREAGIGRPAVRVDRDPAPVAGLGVQTLSASVGGDFAPQPLHNFLVKLGQLDRTVQIRTLRTQRQPIARLDLQIAAYHGPPSTGACALPVPALPPRPPASSPGATSPGAASPGAPPSGAPLAMPPGAIPPGFSPAGPVTMGSSG
jgi:hypothetical protein